MGRALTGYALRGLVPVRDYKQHNNSVRKFIKNKTLSQITYVIFSSGAPRDVNIVRDLTTETITVADLGCLHKRRMSVKK